MLEAWMSCVAGAVPSLELVLLPQRTQCTESCLFVQCALISHCSVFERAPLWAALGEIIELFFLFMWQSAFLLIQKEKYVLKLVEEQREAVRAGEHSV